MAGERECLRHASAIRCLRLFNMWANDMCGNMIAQAMVVCARTHQLAYEQDAEPIDERAVFS